MYEIINAKVYVLSLRTFYLNSYKLKIYLKHKLKLYLSIYISFNIKIKKIKIQ